VGGNYTAGIVGNVVGGSDSVLNMTDVSNTGDITGGNYTAGIVGSASPDDGGTIELSSSSADISGSAYVGAIAGKLVNVSVNSCSNAGSTVSASSYVVENGVNYAYLGGYVGYGYSISNCDNAVTLTYDSYGFRIGGIAGYAGGNITDCENTASITAPNASYVGGIAGYAVNIEFKSLNNSGDITGKDYTAGIIGTLSCPSYRTTTVATCENSGKIVGGNYTAGIVGNVVGGSDSVLNMTDVSNTGDITGGNYTAGIVGSASPDDGGTITGYTNSGTITATGVSNAIAAYLKNITLS
ncbi:MAG: hypothetical protein IKB35_05105, partial [Clostridia bacterium]|nr:hypothetical protein [Clostridia bacterium]